MRIYIDSKRLFERLQRQSRTPEERAYWGERADYCNRRINEIMIRRVNAAAIAVAAIVLIVIIAKTL